MAFTLILLGTDLTFSPAPNEYYPKGESLSFIASLIDGKPIPPQEPANPVQLQLNEAVTVINGPDTLGYQVYNRIAHGVLAVLEAFARGEKNINIAGFSRGAIEAILITHELERIINALKNPSFDIDQCFQSECKQTQEELRRLAQPIRAAINKIKNTEHINIALFTLDPVPGGNYHGLKTGWRDPRFYLIPAIVTEYEQYIFENEHSRSFKSIVPNKINEIKTKTKLTLIPGHHGTGCGNHGTQNLDPIPNHGKTRGKTVKHVQELILLKMLEFLRRNGTVFVTDPTKIKDELHLDEDLIKLLSPFLAKDFSLPALYKEYMRIYKDIKYNHHAYEHFNNTYYSMLGYEESFWDMIGLRARKRIVHVHEHGKEHYIDKVVTPVLPDYFVNDDHINIILEEKLKVQEETSLIEMLDIILDGLEAIYEDDKAIEHPFDNPIVHLAKHEKGAELVLANIHKLLIKMEAKYLNNEPKTAQERAELFDKVKSIFVVFKKIHNSKFKHELLDKLQSGLIGTLDKKIKRLLYRTNKFKEELQRKLANNKTIEIIETDMNSWVANFKRLEEFKQNMQQLQLIVSGFNHKSINQQIETAHKDLIATAVDYVARTGFDIRFLLRAEDLWIYKKMEQDLKEGDLNQDDNEAACLRIINDELMPLTQKYLQHLIQQAKNFVALDPSFSYKDSLPEFIGNQDTKEKYAKIIDKYRLTKKLLETLNHSPAHFLPSESIRDFSRELTASNASIGAYRDKEWKLYAKKCLVAIAVILTGIIPGIIALLAYAKFSNKSPLFFTQSQGKQFCLACENQVNTVIPAA